MQKSEIDSIQIGISKNIRNHSNLVLLVGVFCCSLTASCIMAFCFSVAMSISKPLKNVIRVANFINDSAGNKEVISQITQDGEGIQEVIN